ncbi:hypothetical protein H0H87_002636 [Tephrocybe sp. NHM501043]|nr:hypothetical protein H0H87_002636 [Tephrocybe sp. NHM501043]
MLCAASLVYGAAIPISELRAKAAAGLRLLSLEDGVEPVWKTEDEELQLLRSGQPFVCCDTYPEPSHVPEVTAIIRNITVSRMDEWLSNFTAFNNRYYKSGSGIATTTWLATTLNDIASAYPASNANISIFKHTFGPQGSVIARIPGTSSGPVTILGAHIDTINLYNPMDGSAPGADDDGSGSVNLMEAFRLLLEAGFKPTTTVEFHWYAAEEAGLLGSQAVAKAYKSADTQVKAMMQLDMTAFVKPGSEEVISIMPDFVDERLNDFLKSLIETYSTLKWSMSPPCGYACSDHASWNQQGYPSTYPSEPMGDDNPNVHMWNDTLATPGWSWNYTVEFTKVAVAFAYELAI